MNCFGVCVSSVLLLCSKNMWTLCTHQAQKVRSARKVSCSSQSWTRTNIHGPCRRFRGDQKYEHMRKFCRKFLYNTIASTDNAQHRNCPSSGIDDRPGRDLFKVMKRSPISQPHTLGLRRGYSDGKTVGNTTGLRQRLHPHWRISLLQSL